MEKEGREAKRELLCWGCSVQVKVPYLAILSKHYNWFHYQELQQAKKKRKKEEKKMAEVQIPSLEGSPISRHYLGLRPVKANFFDAI